MPTVSFDLTSSAVVDVGGGVGAWLRVFQQYGTEVVLLVDRAEVQGELLIDRASFRSCDFEKEMPVLPRFELAVCVECAEHLRSERAEALVACVTNAADVVVFSAAVPGQCGKGHVNEQLPEYWRNLFAKCSFVRHDVLRPRIIHDKSVPWWYRQNLFLFARAGVKLEVSPSAFLPDEFSIVHVSLLEPGFRASVRRLWPSFMRGVRSRLGLA